MEAYGKELILDLHLCDVTKFNKESLEQYFKEICELIDMQRAGLHFWEDLEVKEPHLNGTSAIQFIETSNITIHTLVLMQRAYINLFSCKEFSEDDAIKFTTEFFGGRVVNKRVVVRY